MCLETTPSDRLDTDVVHARGKSYAVGETLNPPRIRHIDYDQATARPATVDGRHLSTCADQGNGLVLPHQVLVIGTPSDLHSVAIQSRINRFLNRGEIAGNVPCGAKGRRCSYQHHRHDHQDDRELPFSLRVRKRGKHPRARSGHGPPKTTRPLRPGCRCGLPSYCRQSAPPRRRPA